MSISPPAAGVSGFPESSARVTDEAFCQAYEASEEGEDHMGVWDDMLSPMGFFRVITQTPLEKSSETPASPPLRSNDGLTYGLTDGSIMGLTGRRRGHMRGMPPRSWQRWRLKEPFSGLSHCIGAALSIAALLTLMLAAHGRPLHLVGFALYGVSLVMLFSASALVHSLRVPPLVVARLQRFDYMAIFLLIAGTYAPLCLVTLRGAWGWSLLGVEYGAAIGGIALVATLHRRFPEGLRVGLCAVMTWLALVAFVPLGASLGSAGLGWLLGGIAIYTGGTLILAADWPHLRPGRFSAHDLWHLFVLGGSACHFVLMLRYVAQES